MTGRYDADGVQGQSQAGSEGQVLANRLGIVDIDGINEAELLLLQLLYEAVLLEDLPDRTLMVADLFNLFGFYSPPLAA